MTTTRHAVLKGLGHDKLETVRRYLPANYEADSDGGSIFIHGTDNAGWTLDGYVIPRLASGLYFAREIIAVEDLTAGQRFEFSEEFGGEGQILTATGPANSIGGYRMLNTDELDFTLEFYGNKYVTVVSA
jgi:hypothetical protein